MDTIIKPGKAIVGFGNPANLGTTGTCDHEIGPRYQGHVWVMIATAAAGKTLVLSDFVADIVTKINGKAQRIHSGAQLDAIQSFWGADYAVQIYNYDTGVINYVNGLPQAAQAGKQTICFLTQWFAEPWRKTWAGAEMFTIPTSWADGTNLTSFQTDLTAASNANTTAGTLSAYTKPIYDGGVGPADKKTGKTLPLQLIKWSRNVFPYTAIGVLPLAQGLLKKDSYQEFRLFCPGTDAVSNVKITVNGKTIRDVTKGENDVYALGRGALASAFSLYRFDMIMDLTDKPSDALQISAGGQVVSDWTVDATMGTVGGANNLTVLSSRYGTPD